jgi:hypothetical protein
MSSDGGIRIGNQLVWIDVDTAVVGSTRASQDEVVIVSVRRRYLNGEVIGREIVESAEVASALRSVATLIERRLKETAAANIARRT